MCEYPWSNNDMFQDYTDCHIYIPIYNFLMAFNITFAFIAFIYAISELFKRSRKDMPLVCISNEFFFTLSYLWCLGGNITFANGNYILNLFYGISKGGFYIPVYIFTLRNVEVLLTMDKIKLKHDPALTFLQFIMSRVIIFISIPFETLAVTLSIAFSHRLPMTYSILYAQFILGLITHPILWIYLYKLKKNISLMQTSRHLYDSLDKKLSKLIIVGIITWTIGWILTIWMLYITIFHQNMYIIFNIIMLLMHLSTIRYLHATSTTEKNNEQQQQNNKNSKDILPETKIILSINPNHNSRDNSDESEERAIPLFNPFSSSPSISKEQMDEGFPDMHSSNKLLPVTELDEMDNTKNIAKKKENLQISADGESLISLETDTTTSQKEQTP